jgi:arginine decarboxylase
MRTTTQGVQMSSDNAGIPQNYAIDRWGGGYFAINAHGRVVVRRDPGDEVAVDLRGLTEELVARGLRLPVLIRFNDILRHRVRALCRAFADVADDLGFRGGYRAVYPIKVNQQRSVVEQIVAGGGDCVGLEAGSKPELMAVLATAPRGGVIVCNGYKDREYIRFALIGRRLGYDVYIVIEKPSELDLVLAESASLGIEPLLGVRVRLAAVAAGKWQNSGGARSKFGLSAAQVLNLVERLREHGGLHWLALLHSHIGSQIPDVGDIHRGVIEATRFYVELRQLGLDIRVIDVGGGLGIDYEGSRSNSDCSINYDLRSYAEQVLRPITRACAEHGIPEPMVFSESGRALTAHHAVLVTELIEREPPLGDVGSEEPEGVADDEILVRLRALRAEVGNGLPAQVFESARRLLAEATARFASGDMDLRQRAAAEILLYAIAGDIRGQLKLESRLHREVLEQLEELLADRVFCNFSLFQSLPDVWAIEQIFPVMPLQRLDQVPEQSVQLHDLTCDSDGCIEAYVDQNGIEPTLKLHRTAQGELYLLGIFLIGAYQEILGDMHNLFGDTDAVNVTIGDDGGINVDRPEMGDSTDELLRYVHFDPDDMLDAYYRRLREQGVGEGESDSHYRELKRGLSGYTYLKNQDLS